MYGYPCRIRKQLGNHYSHPYESCGYMSGIEVPSIFTHLNKPFKTTIYKTDNQNQINNVHPKNVVNAYVDISQVCYLLFCF